MNINTSLTNQFRASLAMLRQCVERCPEAVWTSGIRPRYFWQIADHAVFYTHLYLMQNEEAFVPKERHRNRRSIADDDPAIDDPYTIQQTLDYIDYVDARVSEFVDALDLDADDTGFNWYKKMPKMDHVLLNLRHLHGHIGQMSEILMTNGIDTDWISRPPA